MRFRLLFVPARTYSAHTVGCVPGAKEIANMGYSKP